MIFNIALLKYIIEMQSNLIHIKRTIILKQTFSCESVYKSDFRTDLNNVLIQE